MFDNSNNIVFEKKLIKYNTLYGILFFIVIMSLSMSIVSCDARDTSSSQWHCIIYIVLPVFVTSVIESTSIGYLGFALRRRISVTEQERKFIYNLEILISCVYILTSIAAIVMLQVYITLYANFQKCNYLEYVYIAFLCVHGVNIIVNIIFIPLYVYWKRKSLVNDYSIIQTDDQRIFV